MHQELRNQKLILLISAIAFGQLLLHLGAMNQYGFHQDELLYISLGKRLGWGYSETPPFIAIAGKISSLLFGESLIAYRMIPAICAGAIVHLTGMLCIRLGGKFFAVAIACLSVALSSAFLATGALFIPQVFDELFWLLCAYLLVRYTQEPNDKYIYILGAVIGIGLLVKYTLLLYVLGLLVGLLFYPPTRKLFTRPAFGIASLISLAIFMPHLIWQIQNNFPAIQHYRELNETQLGFLSRTDFIIQQLLVNGTGLLIWLPGIYYTLTRSALKPYRFLAIAFIFVILVLLVLNGKPYYGFGAFLPLFALGGVAIEKIIGRFSIFRPLLTSVIIIPNLLLALIVLPYLPIEKAAKVFQWTYDKLDLHFPLKWEDQQIHSVNQNYADMIGWDELAQKTSKLYLSLPEAKKDSTIIFADNYGEAGAIDYYSGIYALPRVISLSSSFELWAPDKIAHNTIIYISARPLPSTLSGGAKKYAQVQNPYSRVKGMGIYLIESQRTFSVWYDAQKAREKSNSFFAIGVRAAYSSAKSSSGLE